MTSPAPDELLRKIPGFKLPEIKPQLDIDGQN
jgi:hypothetical protein